VTPRPGTVRIGTLLIAAAVALAVLRFAAAVNAGWRYDRGDFYATTPPAYAEYVNPKLWNSPDLADSWVFQQRKYLYGPTQYLAIAPLVYAFDSYQTLARFLLGFYAVLIIGAAFLLRQALQHIEPLPARAGALVIAATLGFLPLLQAYAQREFEIVVFAATVAALYFVIRRREWIAGVLFGFITWFKFLPLLWLLLIALRRWTRAVVAFVATSAAVWLAASVTLGLGNFEHLWTLAGQELTEGSGPMLCADFGTSYLVGLANANTTYAGVRYALCRFGTWYSWLPVSAIYFALVATLLVTFLVAFWRLERHGPATARDDSWRRALEASVVIIMTSGVFYSHYYYLCMLAIVIGVLIARYSATKAGWPASIALGVAYLLLTVFVVPPSLSSRLLGFDTFEAYMRLALYFYGEIILIALVFNEYWRLSVRRAAVPA
jgi:hypothetical protein